MKWAYIVNCKIGTHHITYTDPIFFFLLKFIIYHIYRSQWSLQLYKNYQHMMKYKTSFKTMYSISYFMIMFFRLVGYAHFFLAQYAHTCYPCVFYSPNSCLTGYSTILLYFYDSVIFGQCWVHARLSYAMHAYSELSPTVLHTQVSMHRMMLISK